MTLWRQSWLASADTTWEPMGDKEKHPGTPRHRVTSGKWISSRTLHPLPPHRKNRRAPALQESTRRAVEQSDARVASPSFRPGLAHESGGYPQATTTPGI